MAKQTITPIDLAQKYLIKLGMDPLFVQRALLPSLFDENILCKKMTTDKMCIRDSQCTVQVHSLKIEYLF